MSSKLKAVNEIYSRLKEIRNETGEKNLCNEYWGYIEAIMECEPDPEKRFDRAMNMLSAHGQFIFNLGVVTWGEFKEWFDPIELIPYNIFIDQKKLVLRDVRCLLYNSEAKIKGHSYASLFGSSKCFATDTSHINLYDNSGCLGVDVSICAFGESTATIKGYGKLELFDKSLGIASGYSTVILYDESTASSSLNVHVVERK